MSKFKKRLKKAAKIGVGLGAAYALMGAKKDAAANLISGKDSEVGAIAGMDKKKFITRRPAKPSKEIIERFKENVPKDVRAKIRSSRAAGDKVGGIEGTKFSMMSAADVRARNAAQAAKMKEAAKGKTPYSLLGSMGFAKGSKNAVTVMARGCKLGKKKETKIL
jgi:hypothetical protein